MRVKILTDSTCDLRKDVLKKYDIGVISLYVNFDDGMYEDGKDIDIECLFGKVKETRKLPKTSCRSPMDMQNFFQKYLDEGYDQVFYTGIGGTLSGNFQSARIAASEIGEDKVVVVDSLNLSTGIGLLVLKACKLRDEGLDAHQIGEKIQELVPCVRAQFAVKNLEYLHKGGRCSGTTKVIGTLLRIRPILRVFNGKILLSEKIFGIRFEKALDFQIQDLKNNLEHVDKDYLFITHAEADTEAQYVYDNIPEDIKSQFKHIYTTRAGCVISAHCGKGTLGVLYIKDQPLVDDK